MVAEDREDFGGGPLGPANAILVVVTAVALGTAALLALTHESGSGRTAVRAEIESEAVPHGREARKESIAQNPVATRRQLVVYIVRSESKAAELGETLRLREVLSFQFPDYAYENLETLVIVAGRPDGRDAWWQELPWESAHITLHHLTSR